MEKHGDTRSDKTGYVPWEDLPILVLELILDGMAFPDYVRFGSVCRHWRSIQRNHRLLPHHRRKLPFPWLVPTKLESDSIPLYSPHEDRSYFLQQLPEPSLMTQKRCLASSDGWLLLSVGKERIVVLNPISKAQVELPPFPHNGVLRLGALTVDPERMVALVRGKYLMFCRVPISGRCYWIHSFFPTIIKHIVFSRGKIFCLCRPGDILLVVDPRNKPHNAWLDVTSALQHYPTPAHRSFLVECDAAVLLVSFYRDRLPYVPDFQVFAVDVHRKKWVVTGSLGKNMVLIGQGGHTVSCFRADDIVGGRENCIYYPVNIPQEDRSNGKKWKVFDLSSRKMLVDNEPVPQNRRNMYDCPQFKNSPVGWFMPNFDIA